jgi:hypothetical protein
MPRRLKSIWGGGGVGVGVGVGVGLRWSWPITSFMARAQGPARGVQGRARPRGPRRRAAATPPSHLDLQQEGDVRLVRLEAPPHARPALQQRRGARHVLRVEPGGSWVGGRVIRGRPRCAPPSGAARSPAAGGHGRALCLARPSPSSAPRECSPPLPIPPHPLTSRSSQTAAPLGGTRTSAAPAPAPAPRRAGGGPAAGRRRRRRRARRRGRRRGRAARTTPCGARPRASCPGGAGTPRLRGGGGGDTVRYLGSPRRPPPSSLVAPRSHAPEPVSQIQLHPYPPACAAPSAASVGRSSS